MACRSTLSALLLVALLTGCGGGGSSETASSATTTSNNTSSGTTTTSSDSSQETESDESTLPSYPEYALPTQTEAARFLMQASFGPTDASIATLQKQGYEAWIDQQLSAATTYHMPIAETYALADEDDTPSHSHRQYAWWQTALTADDQLRQRVAFALSEIMVVSREDAVLDGRGHFLLNYQDLLLRHAFGNFEELLYAVTLSPVMGEYLSMIRNEKPDEEANVRPDENYAREVMQLFTIGLYQLNQDGTPKLDSAGRTIPTYTQAVIEGFAHVFTGWTYADATRWGSGNGDSASPMVPWEVYHDKGSKTLLDGFQIPAAMRPHPEMEMTIEHLFNHSNVAPFICKQLIQRLVSSNPSSAYVERVASVFNNNGAGERGDLGAVVKAILLDSEARASTDSTAKVKEPLLMATSFWRAVEAYSDNGEYRYRSSYSDFLQEPMRSPSVFNFYRPDYSPLGELSDRDILAPELQVYSEATLPMYSNFFYGRINWYNEDSDRDEDEIRTPYGALLSRFQDDPAALIDHLDTLLLAGTMPSEMRTLLLEQATLYSDTQQDDLVQDLMFLVVSSPWFALQP